MGIDIPSYLLTNFLNTLLSFILFPIGITIVMVCLLIVHKLTPFNLENLFEKGVSGGSIILSAALLGMSILMAFTSI